MHHFQRLNVALSRGRYALYVLYNRKIMHEDPFAKSPFLRALMDFVKANRLVHTMPEPPTASFPDLPTQSHEIKKSKRIPRQAPFCPQSQCQCTRYRGASFFASLLCLH